MLNIFLRINPENLSPGVHIETRIGIQSNTHKKLFCPLTFLHPQEAPATQIWSLACKKQEAKN